MLKSNSPPSCRERTAGSIAILTIWAVLFISLLSLSLSREVAGRLRVASALKWEPKVRAAGTSALSHAVPLFQSDTIAEYDSLRDPWFENETLFRDVPWEGGSYSVLWEEKDPSGKVTGTQYGLIDEERKVSLNGAPVYVLSNLFQVLGGLSPTVADDLALSIVDWRDENSTKEGTGQPEECSYLSFPSRCKNAGFEIPEELYWIPGITPSLFREVKDHLTVHGSGRTNINTATVMLLRAHGLSEAGAGKIVNWRRTNTFQNISWITGRSNEFGLDAKDQAALEKAASSGLFGLRSDVFQGIVRTEIGGKVRGHVGFVVDRQGEVVSWRE